jgi:hypothetical protein
MKQLESKFKILGHGFDCLRNFLDKQLSLMLMQIFQQKKNSLRPTT